MNTRMLKLLLIGSIVTFLVSGGLASDLASAEDATYVGAETCGECHPETFDRFMADSKKAASFKSVKRMAGKLNAAELAECYSCHTTGYGKPGGFVSEQETPQLKDAGCEVCHGPGSLHVESEDPADLIDVTDTDNCLTCHNAERVSVFDFKPMLFGGAH